MPRFLFLFSFLIGSIHPTHAQDYTYKYRYTIEDFDGDGYVDTLVEKTMHPTLYEWSVYAIDGKSGERYCLLTKPGRLCSNFIYYIPIPDQFKDNQRFLDSLRQYTYRTATAIDSFSPEMKWLLSIDQTTRVIEDTTASFRSFKRYADPGIEWIDQPPRNPLHSIMVVKNDSNYHRFRVCHCGGDPPPVFEHQTGYLVYSAENHHFFNPNRTWTLADLSEDTAILFSKHGVIMATDSSYAWLFHSSTRLAPLGYLGIRRDIGLVHRSGNMVIIYCRLGVTSYEMLYVIDLQTGKISGMDVCNLIKCYNEDLCCGRAEIKDESIIFHYVELGPEKIEDVAIPISEVIRKLEENSSK